jgi:hypothetical protein
VIDQRGEAADVDAMLTEHRMMLEAIDAELNDIDEVFHVADGQAAQTTEATQTTESRQTPEAAQTNEAAQTTEAAPAHPRLRVQPGFPVAWGPPSPPEARPELPVVWGPPSPPEVPPEPPAAAADEPAGGPPHDAPDEAGIAPVLPIRRGLRSRAAWLDNTGAVLIAGGLTLLGLALTGHV